MVLDEEEEEEEEEEQHLPKRRKCRFRHVVARVKVKSSSSVKYGVVSFRRVLKAASTSGVVTKKYFSDTMHIFLEIKLQSAHSTVMVSLQ